MMHIVTFIVDTKDGSLPMIGDKTSFSTWDTTDLYHMVRILEQLPGCVKYVVRSAVGDSKKPSDFGWVNLLKWE